MKKSIKYLLLLSLSVAATGCQDFFETPLTQDVVLEDLFATQEDAEETLNGVYYGLHYLHPHTTDTSDDDGVKATGWMQHPLTVITQEAIANRQTAANQNMHMLKTISASLWNSDWQTNAAYETNFLEDIMMGRYYYINRANVFSENIGLLPEPDPTFVTQALAQNDFLKASYYFEMFKRYGSMPMVTRTMEANDPEALTIGTRPALKDFVEYVDGLLVSAIKDLPVAYDDTSDLGRIQRAAAYGLRARLWLYAASPLFNKETAAHWEEAEGHKEKDVLALLNYNEDGSYNDTLWAKAAEYALDAIEFCEANGYALVQPVSSNGVSIEKADYIAAYKFACEKSVNATDISTDMSRWPGGNTEVMMFTRRVNSINQASGPMITRQRPSGAAPETGIMSISNGPGVFQNMVNNYRLADGSLLAESTGEIPETMETYYRYGSLTGDWTTTPWDNYEPRFEAAVIYDGLKIESSSGNFIGVSHRSDVENSSSVWTTGYELRKYFPDQFLNCASTAAGGTVDPVYNEMRLAEMYLIAAEALNESDRQAEALIYLKKTMSRGGLPVATMSFPSDKETLREWILREKCVELAFEYHTFWDCKRLLRGDIIAEKKYGVIRLLLAAGETTTDPQESQKISLNVDTRVIKDTREIQGFIFQECPSYFQWNDYTFDKKQYLWPIIELEIRKDVGWVQNPGY